MQPGIPRDHPAWKASPALADLEAEFAAGSDGEEGEREGRGEGWELGPEEDGEEGFGSRGGEEAHKQDATAAHAECEEEVSRALAAIAEALAAARALADDEREGLLAAVADVRAVEESVCAAFNASELEHWQAQRTGTQQSTAVAFWRQQQARQLADADERARAKRERAIARAHRGRRARSPASSFSSDSSRTLGARGRGWEGACAARDAAGDLRALGLGSQGRLGGAGAWRGETDNPVFLDEESESIGVRREDGWGSDVGGKGEGVGKDGAEEGKTRGVYRPPDLDGSEDDESQLMSLDEFMGRR